MTRLTLITLLYLLAYIEDVQAACELGQYDDNGTCKDCEANKYSDSTTATSCKDCSAGLYSAAKSTAESDCKTCIKGYYPKSGAANGCEKCAQGFYKATDGTDSCTQCPADAGGTITTTSGTGSTSSSQCSLCPSGYYKSNSVCYQCPIGYYGTDGSTCSQCTATKSNSETTAKGSSSVSQCLCKKGYKKTSDTVCDACGAGTYKNVVSDSSTCTGCTTGTTTIITAATASSDCVCAAGYYKSSSMTSCAKCAVGQYSASGATECTACATGTTTSTDGQSSCICDKGYSGYEDQCNPCPVGQYKTSVGSGTSNACTTCPNDSGGTALTTASTGSTAQSDCIKECPAGQYGSSSACTVCPVGQYQPNANQKECISCGSSGYTTDSTGKTAQTDCKCAAGYYGTYNSCTACAKGFYQDTTGQTSCKQCPDDKVTSSVAATASTACIDEPSDSQKYDVTFTIINMVWNDNYDSESTSDYQTLQHGIAAAVEPVFESLAAGISTVYYGTSDWDFSDSSIDVKFDAIFSDDTLEDWQIEHAIKNSLSGTNQLAGSSYQLDPDSISVTEDALEWYIILAIVLGCLVVLGLMICIIVLCIMQLSKRERRRDYPRNGNHYGDRDRMMQYDNRARGRDPGIFNRGAYTGTGTGFDDRKDPPSMLPRPSKNVWQLKDSNWTPRGNEVYGGGGIAPYQSPYFKKEDYHLY